MELGLGGGRVWEGWNVSGSDRTWVGAGIELLLGWSLALGLRLRRVGARFGKG